jgi:hypothetical protein
MLQLEQVVHTLGQMIYYLYKLFLFNLEAVGIHNLQLMPPVLVTVKALTLFV